MILMKKIELEYYYCENCKRNHYSHHLNKSSVVMNKGFLTHIRFDKDNS